ncbi:MAG: protein kinase [Planctomycetaceae bacterium]|nr:protein kinase [Planctomycetaceae bacterium]
MNPDDGRFERLQKFVGPETAPLRERLDRYRLLEVLGEGGTGVVFRARDEELGRDVALKILKVAQACSQVQVERFLRESRNAARLAHPGIATVHEAGKIEDALYYTMELVPGRPFDPRSGTIRDRAAILAKAARAIHHAHEQGILHRDIKPGNLLVDAQGLPHLVDFGVSRDLDGSAGLTRTGAVLGTPYYMAPEQAEGQGHREGPTADIYSLGILLYEALAGRTPFEGGTLREVLQRVVHEEPGRPPGPADLVTIALKAIQKDPSKRYPTAAAFAEDLERYEAGKPIVGRLPSVFDRMRRKMVRRWRLAVGTLFIAAPFALLLARNRAEGDVASGTLDRIEGVVRNAGRAAKVGDALTTGDGLETGPASRASVRYSDGTLLELGPRSALRQGRARVGKPYGRVRMDVSLMSGTLTAEVPAANEPLYVSTLHAEAYMPKGRYELEVAPAWTRLEAWEGTARLGALRGGPVAAVSAGHYGVSESGTDIGVHPMALRLGLPQDGLVAWTRPGGPSLAVDDLTRGWTAFLVLRAGAASRSPLLELGSGADAIRVGPGADGRSLKVGSAEIPAVLLPGQAQRICIVHHPSGGVFVARDGVSVGSGLAPLPPRPSPRGKIRPGDAVEEALLYARALSAAEVARGERSLGLAEAESANVGWKAEYFDGTDLGRRRLTRRDPEINFDWGPESPDLAVGADHFSVRWTGRLDPLYTEPTTFYVLADDGVRLWVDGTLVVDSWIDQIPTEFSATIPLVAGRGVDIRMEFYEQGSSAQAKLWWSGPSIPKSPVPGGRVSPLP